MYRDEKTQGLQRKMLFLEARVDLKVMAMKEYFLFPKAPALLESYDQIV